MANRYGSGVCPVPTILWGLSPQCCGDRTYGQKKAPTKIVKAFNELACRQAGMAADPVPMTIGILSRPHNTVGIVQ